MKKVETFLEYQAIAERYGHKGARSNDYIYRQAADLIIHNQLFSLCGERNAFLFVKKDVGMRVYYYLNDFAETIDISGYGDLVTEILFRGDVPQEEVDYLARRGFRLNIVRDQYAAMYQDLQPNLGNDVQGVRIALAENMEDVEWACELFNQSFDRLSGDFIPAEMYPLLRQEHSILLAQDEVSGMLLGALHQSKEQGVNWISHVAVVKGARGSGIGSALVDAFIRRNMATDRTRYMLWVQRQNEAAVKMYKNKGFKYINKSTLSLIK